MGLSYRFAICCVAFLCYNFMMLHAIKKSVFTLILATSVIAFLPTSIIGTWCSAIYSQTFIVDSGEEKSLLGDNTNIWQDENGETERLMESNNVALIRVKTSPPWGKAGIGMGVLISLAGLALFFRRRTIKT